MSDDLNLNEVDCVRLLVSANQEVFFVKIVQDKFSYGSCFVFLILYFKTIFSVGFIWEGATGDFTPCRRALVYRET